MKRFLGDMPAPNSLCCTPSPIYKLLQICSPLSYQFIWIQPIPRTRVLIAKLIIAQLINKFPSCYENIRFITTLMLLGPVSNLYNPIHIVISSLLFLLFLSSHILLGISRCPCPSEFQIKVTYAYLISSSRARCPIHRIIQEGSMIPYSAV